MACAGMTDGPLAGTVPTLHAFSSSCKFQLLVADSSMLHFYLAASIPRGGEACTETA